MKRSIAALVFLFAMLAMAGVVHAIPGNSSPTTISITDPDDADKIVLGSTPQKLEAFVNFTYRVSSDNNVSWCKLFANGTRFGLNSSIDRNIDEHFDNLAFTNGTWWYYVQCRDNYTNLYNSSNHTLVIDLDDTPPTVLASNTLTTYNTTDGMATFRFNATDYDSGMDNCTLIIEGEERAHLSGVGNSSNTPFPKMYLPGGDYTWKVVCQDKAGNLKESAHGLLIAELKTTQSILLNSPDDEATDFDGFVTFNFTPQSRLPIKWCVLQLNSTFNKTNNVIVNNTWNLIEDAYISDGPYNWSIACTDSDANNVSSGDRGIHINRTTLMSNYLNVKISYPLDYYKTDNGLVNFEYTPKAVLGLDRCELITNGSVREAKTNPSSGESATFLNVQFSEGTWDWRIHCVDKSENEVYSPLANLEIIPVPPEPIPEPPVVPISEKINETDVSEEVGILTGWGRSLGLSGATWIILVVLTMIIGTGAVVIVVDKKFELELIKDAQLILYKLNIRKEAPDAKKKHPLTDEHKKALKDYIKFHMTNGVARGKIEAHLKTHKWNEQHIKTVFKELEAEWEEWRGKFVETK
jgi:hypothetical protein|tara:strand:+ start:1218 stop:2957 length:1740 start_codon:yes stop_codon:yes gene_type:complete